MTLIIGGKFQGKTDYAVNNLGIKREEILDAESCSFDDVLSAKAIRHFEALVKRAVSCGKSTKELVLEIISKNPAITIISAEIGKGIIPLEKSDRIWREETGRACCVLAEFSKSVIRINCGLSSVIKGDLQ